MWQGMAFAPGVWATHADTLEHMLWASENGPLQSYALLHRGTTTAKPIHGRYQIPVLEMIDEVRLLHM